MEVAYDPDYPHGAAERTEQQAIVQELYDMLARLAYVCEAMAEVRDTARERAGACRRTTHWRPTWKPSPTIWTPCTAALMVTEEVQGISGKKKLRENVVRLYASIAGYGGRPTGSQVERMAGFRTEIAGANTAFTALTEAELGELNAALAAQGLEPVELLTPEAHAARGE